MARFTGLAWALLAASLLLFQPICEAAELYLSEPQPASQVPVDGDGQSGFCCPMIEAAPVPVATAAAAAAASSAIATPAVDLPALPPRKLAYSPPATAAPLPVPRYHARSARIQR